MPLLPGHTLGRGWGQGLSGILKGCPTLSPNRPHTQTIPSSEAQPLCSTLSQGPDSTQGLAWGSSLARALVKKSGLRRGLCPAPNTYHCLPRPGWAGTKLLQSSP